MTKIFVPDLHIERASDPSNLFYLTVLQYRKEYHLVVIDNISKEEVSAYVLDMAPQEGIDLKELISIITKWFYASSEKYPLSIEFSKLGLSSKTNKILKNFDLNHVTRMVGCDFQYDFSSLPKVRRRRVQQVQKIGAEILARSSVTAY